MPLIIFSVSIYNDTLPINMQVLGPKGMSPWGNRPSFSTIESDAMWIWTHSADRIIGCRSKRGKVSPMDK